MSNDKMQAEFEAAFVQNQVANHGEGFRSSAVYMLKRSGEFEKPPTPYELKRRELGLYDMNSVELTWWSWQASRAAVVIELPAPDWSYENHGHLLDKEAVVAAIESQGLKVKS